MAPQEEIPVSATVLGTIGTVLWMIQLIPQIWTNWRTKTTEGLPGSMVLLWAIASMFFGAYGVIQNFNIPIQIQPQAIILLSSITYAQTLVYKDKWRTWKAVTLVFAAVAILGAIEAVLIVTIRPIYEGGNEAPILVIGILATTLMTVSLILPYGEIWKRRGRVIGFNWIFLLGDWLGGFFSLMALAAQNSFDVLGGILYILLCALELGIFVSHAIWLLRTQSVRKAAKKDGKTFDQFAAERKIHGEPFKFAERERTISSYLPFVRSQANKKDEEADAAVDIEKSRRPHTRGS